MLSYPEIIKPMKGVHYDPATLQFPVLASPKLDGFRCIAVNGEARSNTNKTFPNLFIKKYLHRPEFNGFDNEIIVGKPYALDVYNKTSSGVTSIQGEPDFGLYMFDTWDNYDLPFSERNEYFYDKASKFNNVLSAAGLMRKVRVLPQTLLNSLEELDEYESERVGEGYEGVMLRSLDGKYKFGRSTAKQGWLLKVKRFVDAEAVIVGFEELMHNENEAYINEQGHTKRSSEKAGKVASGILGSYICQSPLWEGTFRVGCGSMKADERKARFDSFEQDKGKTITFKHFPHGSKDKPRHAIFRYFRAPIDLSI